jgi:hypothetical protein
MVMALRLRRGTDAERLLITPLEGELIYTTDTKKLYIGDGITVGGIAIDTAGGGGLADLSSSSINDLADVNADSTTPADGNVLTYDATSGDWRAAAPTGGGASTLSDLTDINGNVDIAGDGDVLMYDHVNEIWRADDLSGRTYNIKILGDDSTLMVDTFNGRFTGSLDGDVTGSLYSDSSTLLVDGINNKVVCDIENEFTYSTSLASTDIRIGSPLVGNNIITTISTDTTSLVITTANTNGSVVSGRPLRVGGTSSGYPDGFLTVYNETPLSSAVEIISNADSANSSAFTISKSRGDKGSPTAIQSGDILGAVITAGYNGSAYRNAGGINVQATDAPGANNVPAKVQMFTVNSSGIPETKFSVDSNGTAQFTGAMQLVNYTDATARDAAITSPAGGMMCFITSTAKVQVYSGATWIDLN